MKIERPLSLRFFAGGYTSAQFDDLHSGQFGMPRLFPAFRTAGMSFRSVAQFPVAIRAVGFVRACNQVCRVAARWIIALVKNRQIVRYCTVLDYVCNSMRRVVSDLIDETPIAIFVNTAPPYPTISNSSGRYGHVGPETSNFFNSWCRWVFHSVDYTSLMMRGGQLTK